MCHAMHEHIFSNSPFPVQILLLLIASIFLAIARTRKTYDPNRIRTLSTFGNTIAFNYVCWLVDETLIRLETHTLRAPMLACCRDGIS